MTSDRSQFASLRNLLACIFFFAASIAHATPGVEWLTSQITADGSFSNPQTLSVPFQSTAEVLRTFDLLGEIAQPAIPLARQFIDDEIFGDTEYLVRKITTNLSAGAAVDLQIAELIARQNIDGGFGDFANSASTVFDTLLTLEALALAGQSGYPDVSLAIGYLINRQNNDGGWSDGGNGSSVFLTALVVDVLVRYKALFNVESQLLSGQSFLLSRRDSGGLWGENFVSAQALIALVRSLNDLAPIANSLSAFRAEQSPDGSWNGDVFSTALALRALKLAETPPSTPGLASIHGVVVDGRTGLPLSGVTTRLVGPSNKTQIVGNNGVFEFKDLAPGNYKLQLALTGYMPLSAETLLAAGQRIDFGILQLLTDAAATTSTIRGIVTDSDSGLPLQAAVISVSGVTGSTLSAGDGSYQIAGVPQGAVTIQASKDNFSTVTTMANLSAGSLYVFSPTLVPVSQPITAIQGTITDSATGLAIQGATIGVAGSTIASTSSSADGTYRIDGLVAGDIMITVSAAGFDSVSATATLFENNVIVFSPVLFAENTSPPTANTAGAEGVVMDSVSNQSLANVVVTADFEGVSSTATTGADGRFVFSGLKGLQGTIRFNRVGYLPRLMSVNLEPLALLNVGQVRLRPEGVTELLPDLIAGKIDTLAAATDPATLELRGNINVRVNNQGTSRASSGVQVIAFRDVNLDGIYSQSVDSVLGVSSTLGELQAGSSENVQIDVSGILPYRDAPVSVFVDGLQSVAESNELNNVTKSTSQCAVSAPPPVSSVFSPTVKWSVNLGGGVVSTPIAGPLIDTNGDGRVNELDSPYVIAVQTNGTIVALNGVDGSMLWQHSSPVQASGLTSPALADIDGDGQPEVIVINTGDFAGAINNDGTLKWISNERANRTFGSNNGGITIADLEGDGFAEVIIGDLVLNSDGSTKWRGADNQGDGNNVEVPVVADLDLDGSPEVIMETIAHRADGSVYWKDTTILTGGKAVGNFDNDPFPEIVVVRGGQATLFEHDGTIKWGPVAFDTLLNGGFPTIVDVDGDGVPEIGVAGFTKYSLLNADGSIKWQANTHDGSGLTGSAAFDFDGDGIVEIAYADDNKLHIFNGLTGNELFSTPNSSITGTENPIIVDVDGDDHADLVVPSSSGIRVFQNTGNDWVNTRRIWNQHAYHITNINDDASVPAVEVNNWQTHNNYRVNLVPQAVTGATPDLSVSVLRLVNNAGGDFTLSTRVGNAGGAPSPDGVVVSFYEGDPDAGGILLGSVTVQSLLSDSFQDIQLTSATKLSGNADLFAVVDVNGQIAECREDNNRVQIPGPDLKPDLVVDSIDRTGLITDLNSLSVTGSIGAAVSNSGTLRAPTGVQALAFYDSNRNGLFDNGIDDLLGQSRTTNTLETGATENIAFQINGRLPFRDAPIKVWIDSQQEIQESTETNNVTSTASACQVNPDSAQFEPVLKWEWTGSPVESAFNQVVMAPAVAQTTDDNGDGKIDSLDIPDVIFTSYMPTTLLDNGMLRIISGDNGAEHVTVTDPAVRLTAAANLAVGDIDADDLVEIVGVKSQGGLVAFNNDGSVLWSIPSTSLPTNSRNWGSPSIADIDQDGQPEIIYGATVLNSDGSVRWVGSGPYIGNTTFPNTSIVGVISYAVDLGFSPGLELVAGGSAYDKDGNLLWVNSTAGEGLTAVGNFNDDDSPEIVVVGRGAVTLISHLGETIWGPVAIPGGGNGGPPTVADMDGDGLAEIGVAAAGQYVVFNHDGTLLWQAPIQDLTSSSTGSSVFDFDGDGRAEVAYADETSLRIYDGLTGSVRFSVPNDSGTWTELPVIVDVDNDDHADIIVCANTFLAGATTNGVRVFEDKNNSWVNTRKIWNQNAYHIDNVNDDGSIPQVEPSSWLTHNTFRLNDFQDRQASSVPDLTASLLSVIDNGSGQPSSLKVRVGNAGNVASPEQIQVSFFDGDPSNGGVLLGAVSLGGVAPGDYQDIQLDGVSGISVNAVIFVLVDAADQLSECDETNNLMSLAVPASASGVITVSSNQSLYGANEPALLQASVNNGEALEGNFTAQMQIEDLAGALVATFPVRDLGALSGGETVSLVEPWHTATFIAGGYVLRGSLRGTDGIILSESTRAFVIQNAVDGSLDVALRTTTDRPVYHITDTVQIDDLVQNLTVNTLIENATLRLSVQSPDGIEVLARDSALGLLPANALRTVLTPFAFTDARIGTYSIMAQVLDTQSGEVLAVDQVQYEIKQDIERSLTGSVLVQSTELEIGQTQICSDTITNDSSLDIEGLQIRQLVVSLQDQQEFDSRNATIDLAAAATQTLVHDVGTRKFPAEDYGCVVQANIEGVWVTLAFDTFSLVVPPINITTGLEQADAPRLLVLLDTPGVCDNDDDSDDDEDSDDGCSNVTTDSDPGGPSDAPLLSEQRHYLEDILKTQRWSYRIVSSAEVFTRELRSGGYTAYALFSERIELEKRVQKELREAVFRGEGLLVTVNEDDQYEALTTALGIKLKDKLSAPTALSVEAVEDITAGSADFTLIEPVRRVTLQGAEAVARYPGLSACSGEDDDDGGEEDGDSDDDSSGNNSHDAPDCTAPAIALTHHRYGDGHSLGAGFDLLAQAALPGADQLFPSLLIEALAATRPSPPLPLLTGRIAALQLTLTNQGIATPGQAVITPPADSQTLDPGLATAQPDGRLLWPFNLAENTSTALTFWLQLPEVVGPAITEALLQVGISPDLADYDSLQLSLDLNRRPELGDVVDTLTALAAQDEAYEDALEEAQKAKDSLNQGKAGKALKAALKAADALSVLDQSQVDTVRRQLALAITIIEQQL